MTLYEEVISMIFKLIGIAWLFLCTSCNAGSSLMKNYKIDGADKQLIVRFGETLNSRHLDDAEAFIESTNFDVDLPDKEGRTLLVAAVLSDDYKTTEKLLKLGADPNLLYPDYKSKSVMGWAAAYKNDSYLKLLTKYNADINLLQERQRTLPSPIYDAIAADRHENLRFLLNNGANPNVVNKSGHSPLMFAITSASWEMVMMMLDAGADYKFKNKWNEDAASAIERQGLGTEGKNGEWRKKVIQFFKQKGIELDLRVPL